VLVACVFDGFVTAYLRRMSDLLRLTQGAAGADVGYELARRLADDASRTARQFMDMCVRAIDYCPPVDISFGDFLRALITVDTDLVQEDSIGYRAALIEAFAARGVDPGGDVGSYSEESLRWEQPRDRRDRPLVCRGLRFDVVEGTRGASLSQNARILSEFGRRHASALRLDPKLPVQAFSFHPVYRVGKDGQLGFQVVAQLLQRRRVAAAGRARSEDEVFRGGCTLIVDLPEGVVRYGVYKRVHSRRRLACQEAFREEWRGSQAGPYLPADGLPPRASFARLHKGY
jgi:hypothetical protein